jgi:prophage antirepressor-like protein
MNNQVQKFHSHEFGSIDILMIDDKPYFPATACARTLGYTNPEKAIRDHCKGVNETFTPSAGGMQKKRFIPEGDLYRLIVRSKLPAAERFEKWVFDEVLPCIRKHGAYLTPGKLEQTKADPKLVWKLVRALSEEQKRCDTLEERNEKLAELASEMATKANYCDIILNTNNAIPVTLIAKDYGMTASRFNQLLHALGVQFKVGGAWALYADLADQGYTRTQTYYVNERTSILHMFWTQKGRRFLYDTLKGRGILPLVELRGGGEQKILFH